MGTLFPLLVYTPPTKMQNLMCYTDEVGKLNGGLQVVDYYRGYTYEVLPIHSH